MIKLKDILSESSILLQKPLHTLAKEVFEGLDDFFLHGSAELNAAKKRGYRKVDGSLYTKEIPLILPIKVKSDKAGEKTKLQKPQREEVIFIFSIYPSSKFNPEAKGYSKNAAGYFEFFEGYAGPVGAIVIHLEQMGIPLLDNFQVDKVPFSSFDIRDDKVRRKVYDDYKTLLRSVIYHESTHAIKQIIYDFAGGKPLTKKYKKYFDQPKSARKMVQYADIGDEREAILAGIMSDVKSFVKNHFENFPAQEQTLVTALNRSEDFKKLVEEMLDTEKMAQIANKTRDWRDHISHNFGVYYKPDGEVIVKWNMGWPLDQDIVKWISPKYQPLFKSFLKKLVEWWKITYPRKLVKSPVGATK